MRKRHRCLAMALGVGWSGRRDLNPRPSPWQGDALPLSHFRVGLVYHSDTGSVGGAEAQNRTGDTSIFSAVLYLLSYLGENIRSLKAPRGPWPTRRFSSSTISATDAR